MYNKYIEDCLRKLNRVLCNNIINAIKVVEGVCFNILQTSEELHQPPKFFEFRSHANLLASCINMFWITLIPKKTYCDGNLQCGRMLPALHRNILPQSFIHKMEDVFPPKQHGPFTRCNDSEDSPPPRKSEISMCKNFPLTAITPAVQYDLHTT
jgi:hypothetical protein